MNRFGSPPSPPRRRRTTSFSSSMVLGLQLLVLLLSHHHHRTAEAFLLTDTFSVWGGGGWWDGLLRWVCGLAVVGDWFCGGETSAIPFQKLRARDGAAADRFGRAAAVSSVGGGWAVVGAPYADDGSSDLFNSGAAYIFKENGGDDWIQEAKLVPAPGSAVRSGDMFGRSVDIASSSFTAEVDGGTTLLEEHTAIVGAPHHDRNGVRDQGCAYIFVGWQQPPVDGGSSYTTAWTQQAQLTADDGRAFDRYGAAVAVSHRTAAVGAHSDDDRGGNSGSVYVYARRTTAPQDSATAAMQEEGWTQQAKLVAGDARPTARFGDSVGLVGDALVVGAPGDRSARGAAYVFQRRRRSGAITNISSLVAAEWTQQAKLVAADGAPGDRFGQSVSLCDTDDSSSSCSQPTILVGAAQHQSHGAAYIFVRDDDGDSDSGSWTQQAKLTAADVTAPSGSDGGVFGNSVSVSQDLAVVGASLDREGRGAVYTFQKQAAPVPSAVVRGADAAAPANSALLWTLQTKLRARDGAAHDQFGAAVGLSGRTALVGAPVDGDSGGAGSGSAYLFQLDE